MFKAESKILDCLDFFKENNLPAFEYNIDESSEDNIYNLYCQDLIILIKIIEEYIKENYYLFKLSKKEFDDLTRTYKI